MAILTSVIANGILCVEQLIMRLKLMNSKKLSRDPSEKPKPAEAQLRAHPTRLLPQAPTKLPSTLPNPVSEN